MNPAPCIYFVEAVTPVTVAVLSLKKYRNVLKQDVKFMNLIASISLQNLESPQMASRLVLLLKIGFSII